MGLLRVNVPTVPTVPNAKAPEAVRTLVTGGLPAVNVLSSATAITCSADVASCTVALNLPLASVTPVARRPLRIHMS